MFSLLKLLVIMSNVSTYGTLLSANVLHTKILLIIYIITTKVEIIFIIIVVIIL